MEKITGTDYLDKYGRAATEMALAEQLDFSDVDLKENEYVECLISDCGTMYTSYVVDPDHVIPEHITTIENYGDVSLENDVELDDSAVVKEIDGWIDQIAAEYADDEFADDEFDDVSYDSFTDTAYVTGDNFPNFPLETLQEIKDRLEQKIISILFDREQAETKNQ